MRGIVLAPLIPGWLLGVLGLLCAAAVLLAAIRRAPGWWLRGLACAVALGWLAGPRHLVRTGTKLPDIAILAVDRSASMQVGTRAALAESTAAALLRQQNPDLRLRRIDITNDPAHGDGGTRLFDGIAAALADIPLDQRAGVIAITDGMVADAPNAYPLPVTALLTALGEQTDRRLRITTAPGYGIVGQEVKVGLTVDDLGATPGGAETTLSWSQDGAPPNVQPVTVGEPASITIPITHPGPVTVAISVAPLAGEASLLNNRAALTINGVRDRLRVLLISGQPHAGERTWRRLLKADPAVDLVHFTILRPPGKDDLTPINDLALIAFPTRELFVDKISQFDLIILDRFSNPGILPPSYVQNIADYVGRGGALLVSAGPELAAPGNLADGPIGAILPATPASGPDAVVTGAFRPTVTPLGERHPVTANLAGDIPGVTPDWGNWYRRIAVTDPHGLPPHAQVLMTAGADGPPLLLTDHVGEGRVALLLSDQIWLWSRGHQGGGPQAELLRRIAHWLMKEPELDENALTARIVDGTLTLTQHNLTQHTLAEPAPTATITDPDGTIHTVPFDAGGSLSMPATMPGLWQAQAGNQRAAATVEPGDAAEFADLRATASRLRPAGATIRWLLPSRPPDLTTIALRHNHALHLTSLSTSQIFPDWLVVSLFLLFILAAWWREGHS